MTLTGTGPESFDTDGELVSHLMNVIGVMSVLALTLFLLFWTAAIKVPANE